MHQSAALAGGDSCNFQANLMNKALQAAFHRPFPNVHEREPCSARFVRDLPSVLPA